MKAWSKREVLAFIDRIEPVLSKVDHFELLDVSPDSSPGEIQRAFHNMAGALHPDRHRRSLSSEQHERLVVVYARIAEAYRVLRDEGERDAYLRAAARDRSGSSCPEARLAPEAAAAVLGPKAQRLYRRAQAALRTGDRASAVLNLRMALALHPTSTLLREALAEALGADS